MKTVLFSLLYSPYNNARVVLGLVAFSAIAAVAMASPGTFSPLPPEQMKPANSALQPLPPGTIIITSPAQPGAFGAASPNPRVQSAAEGAGDAARAVLNTPHLGHPQLESCVGVLGFAAAPFAAAYGALDARHQLLSPDQMRDAEAGLSLALSTAARQENFSRFVFESARDNTRRSLAYEPNPNKLPRLKGASALLETRVERVELKKAPAGKNNYYLDMQARVRLVSTTDKVLLDRHYSYQSGTDMFVDWTRNGAVESVAETGYRELAHRVAREVFAPVPDAPVFIGATGHAQLALAQVPQVEARKSRAAATSAPSGVQKISYLQAEPGTLEVRSSRSDLSGSISGMPSQPPAQPELPTDTEWALGGLQDDRNSVVQATACLAAVPMGLWEQTFGVVQTHSREKAASAVARLDAVARQAHLQDKLSQNVVQDLRKATSEPPGPDDFAVRSAQGNLGLEVRVLRTELAGKPRLGAQTAVCVDTLATVYRSPDHQELYVFPVLFRSSPKKLAEWAANDGQLFRGELQKCSAETATAIAARMLSRGFVAPSQTPAPIAANR